MTQTGSSPAVRGCCRTARTPTSTTSTWSCPNVGPVYVHPRMEHPFDIGGGHAHIVDYQGNVLGLTRSGANSFVAGIVDIEALRQFRVMNLNSNWMKDLRTELFRRMYEAPDPPAQPLARAGPAAARGGRRGLRGNIGRLVERGACTPPSRACSGCPVPAPVAGSGRRDLGTRPRALGVVTIRQRQGERDDHFVTTPLHGRAGSRTTISARASRRSCSRQAGARTRSVGVVLRSSAPRSRRVLSSEWRRHGSPALRRTTSASRRWSRTRSPSPTTPASRRFVPCAASHSGFVAIELRRRFPDRVPALVHVDWYVVPPPPPYRAVLEMLTSRDGLAGRARQALRDLAGGVERPGDRRRARGDAPPRRRHVDAVGSRDRGRYARGRQPDGRVGVARAPVPRCCTLYGQPRVPAFLAVQEAFAAEHPWFTVRQLPGTTHFAMIETPRARRGRDRVVRRGAVTRVTRRPVPEPAHLRREEARGLRQSSASSRSPGADRNRSSSPRSRGRRPQRRAEPARRCCSRSSSSPRACPSAGSGSRRRSLRPAPSELEARRLLDDVPEVAREIAAARDEVGDTFAAEVSERSPGWRRRETVGLPPARARASRRRRLRDA